MFIEDYFYTYDIFTGSYGSPPMITSKTYVDLHLLNSNDFIGRAPSLRIYRNGRTFKDSFMMVSVRQVAGEFQVYAYDKEIVLITEIYLNALNKALSIFHETAKAS